MLKPVPQHRHHHHPDLQPITSHIPSVPTPSTHAPHNLLPFRLRFRSIRLELPCRHPLDEHLVDLLVAAAAGLRVAEVKIDRAEDGEAAEDEGRLCAEVGFIRVEDERDDEGPHGEKTGLQGEADGGSFRAEARGRYFRQGGVGGCADGEAVDESTEPEQDDNTLDTGRGVGLDGDAAGDEEEDGQEAENPHADVATADFVGDESGADVWAK